MRSTCAWIAVAALGLALLAPPVRSADNKDMQRIDLELLNLNESLVKMQKAQDDKLGAIQPLLQQLSEANAKLTADLRALKDEFAKSQADQQVNVQGPLKDLNRKFDDLSDRNTDLSTALGKLDKRMKNVEDQSGDVKTRLDIIIKDIEEAPKKVEPPVSTGPSPADAATLAFAKAQAERIKGTPQSLGLALGMFLKVTQDYAAAPEAPMAMFEMGAIYMQNGQYAEAKDAYDQVLERFGDNPLRSQAYFRKAQALENTSRPDAIREYTNVVKQYPGDYWATAAADRLKELTAAAKPAPKAAPKGKKGKGGR